MLLKHTAREVQTRRINQLFVWHQSYDYLLDARYQQFVLVLRNRQTPFPFESHSRNVGWGARDDSTVFEDVFNSCGTCPPFNLWSLSGRRNVSGGDCKSRRGKQKPVLGGSAIFTYGKTLCFGFKGAVWFSVSFFGCRSLFGKAG